MLKKAFKIFFFFFINEVLCSTIDWESFDKKAAEWAKDFHNHLQSIDVMNLNMKVKGDSDGKKSQQDQELKDVQFFGLQLALFEDFVVPYEKDNSKKVLKIKFDRLSLRVQLVGFPEVGIRFRNCWFKVLFGVGPTKETTFVEKLRISFNRIEWEEGIVEGVEGEVDSQIFLTLKNGVKELEPSLAASLDYVFKKDHEKIYNFFLNNEYSDYDFGDFLKHAIHNYNVRNKIINVDSKWLKNLVEGSQKKIKEMINEKVLPNEKKVSDEKKRTDL